MNDQYLSMPVEGYYIGLLVSIARVLPGETVQGGRWVKARLIDPDTKKKQFGIELRMWSTQIMTEPWGSKVALSCR